MKYDYVIIQDNQVIVEGKNADDLELIEELENLGVGGYYAREAVMHWSLGYLPDNIRVFRAQKIETL